MFILKGYGNALNYRMGVPLLQDVVQSMEQAIAAIEGVSYLLTVILTSVLSGFKALNYHFMPRFMSIRCLKDKMTKLGKFGYVIILHFQVKSLA